MSIEVIEETLIARDRRAVARFAADPANDRCWIGGIREAQTLNDQPFGVGTRVRRRARFLGKSIDYILEVREYEAGSSLAMTSVSGPFPMQVKYRFDDDRQATRMQIEIRGNARGFFGIASPLLARHVRRNVKADLQRLKQALESDVPLVTVPAKEG